MPQGSGTGCVHHVFVFLGWWSQRVISCLKPGACLRWILTQTNEVETTNDDWTLDLLKVHVVKFASVFPHYVTGGNPCYSACHTCHTCYKRWIMGRRGRQTIPVLMCFLLRTDVDGGGTPGRCLEVSRAPQPPPLPAHSITTTTSSKELTDRSESWLSGRIGTPQAARHCYLHLAISHVLYLCMLPCLHIHLQGKSAREHAGRISLWLQSWMTMYLYRRMKWTHVSNVFWLSATPKFSFQDWSFCPIQPSYLFV